jgi:type III secretion protein N (ATPase)
LGKPIDGKTLSNCIEQPLYQDAPNPLSREPITTAFHTGVRAIDGVLTTGLGQRMGIFAVAGGGKSTLLSMMAKQAVADVIVIALIGERGREVREFIEHNLGEQGMARSVLVVATSDRPSMERARAAYTATAIAEGFRDQGKNVLLLMDSATRFARALREIGLSVGEPAVRRGFPPSVFAELPRLFERTGSNDKGTITAFYTVLVEDEDAADPVAEEVRSILDGHIVLSRQLGQEGHYPAIDVLGSASRIFNAITEPVHQQWAMHLRKLLAEYKKVEFLIQVGEYQQGADPVADEAIQKREALKRFLCQDVNDHQSFDNTLQLLAEAVGV